MCGRTLCRGIVNSRLLLVRNAKRMRIISAAVRWGALWSALGLLAGCGYFGGSQSPLRHHLRPKMHAPPPGDPVAKAVAAMVEAVGPSGSQAPIEVRFSIHDRPQVGKDDEVDYALIPQVGGLETIGVVFASLNGLQVVSHGPVLAAIKPASGVPILGSVIIRPVKTGLFTLTATVSVQSSSESDIWPFTIPVIAGGEVQSAERPDRMSGPERLPPGMVSGTAQAANQF